MIRTGISTDEDVIGRTLGHYRILERLGTGGMGVVWLAEDLHLRRRVALKMLREDLARSPEKLARFEREAKAVAALNHPNIVTIHAIEEIEGVRFLAMEFIEGKTLDELIPPGGFSLPEFLRVALPVTEALSAAHARGILHRDLKPANIAVGPDGRVKVLDFGLAKLQAGDATAIYGREAESTLTQEGSVVGTLQYMSPEQLQLKHIDHRSDLFSLGIVLYEMATGDLPFRGESAAQVISSVLRDEPRRLDDLDARLPPEIADTVARCLEKDVTRRPSSAAEVRDRLALLAHALETGQVNGASTRLKRLVGRVRRRTRLATLAAAGALALALVALPWAIAALRARFGAGPAGGGELPAVAVLPFANYSGDPEYFVDGMTDGLIGSLARLGGLRVISRQSSMHYKSSDKRLPEIARELAVDYVVEGSISRDGDRLRLQAQLLRPDPERQVFSRVFEGLSRDVLSLHNQVAQAVATALEVRLSPTEETRMAATKSVDPAVYEAYLQARHWAGKHGEEEFRRAQGYFERAIALDPTFSPAWTELADIHKRVGFYYADLETSLGRAETAVRRALELDPDSPEAHAVYGDLLAARWDWEGAEAQLRRAVELGPGSGVTHVTFWRLLARLHRFDEGMREIELARRLDPLSANIAANYGMQLALLNRNDEALAQFKQTLEIDPAFRLVHAYSWLVYHRLAKDPERGRELGEWLRASGFDDLMPEYERTLASDGYPSALSWVANRLDATSGTRTVRLGIVAGLLACAGEPDKAMAWLERGYENREWELGWIAVTSDYRDLWGREDFQRLVKRLGLPVPQL
jgi:TolB-like protein/Tfp pilus assembly protein PilF/predicted Ser/Thr protein kinase